MRLRRHPPALCGPWQTCLGKRCCLPCPPPATCWTKAQLRRNGEILLGVQQRTGCKILLAQKAFSNFRLSTRCWLLIWRAPRPAACTRAAWAKKSCRKKRTMCSAPPTGQTSSRSCCSTPTTSCSTRPASWQSSARQQRRRARAWACGVNPECSTQEGHAIYDPCAPGSRLGTTRAQWDAAVHGRPGPARITGRTALPHPVRAGCRCTGA